MVVDFQATEVDLLQQALPVFPVRPFVLHQGARTPGQPHGRLAGARHGTRANYGYFGLYTVQRPAN